MSDSFQLFNLDTMSGVFPGTRTLVYQRVRLMALAVEEESVLTTGANIEQRWARIFWYDEPPSCVVALEARSDAPAAGDEADRDTRLVRIPTSDPATLMRVLPDALAASGWRLATCGSCAHWSPLTAHNPDGLATGRCLHHTGAFDLPPQLGAQSMLALACSHWTVASASEPVQAAADDTTPYEITPIRKRAEQENDERWTLTGQLRRWLRKSPAPEAVSAGKSWEARVVERSGVGAGTEPCFACQGRLANLGALATATPEGDKRTFSVWRCRNCYTYYLNDWTDRWERTDSLETEERYYRLSPAEAMELLAVIDNVVHAEHPARRHERTAQRDWVLGFIGERPMLSHQVRQGR